MKTQHEKDIDKAARGLLTIKEALCDLTQSTDLRFAEVHLDALIEVMRTTMKEEVRRHAKTKVYERLAEGLK